MKSIKLEMPTERDVQLGKEEPYQSKLEVKSETELKNTNNKAKAEKRREEKRRKKL